MLLVELGLVHDKEHDEWPLYISPTVLSLFGRLALAEQEMKLKQGADSADTPRAENAWKLLLRRLAKSRTDKMADQERGF